MLLRRAAVLASPFLSAHADAIARRRFVLIGAAAESLARHHFNVSQNVRLVNFLKG